MLTLKELFDNRGHFLFFLAERRNGDQLLKKAKRMLKKLLHTLLVGPAQFSMLPGFIFTGSAPEGQPTSRLVTPP
jgi:hypothetical protein